MKEYSVVIPTNAPKIGKSVRTKKEWSNDTVTTNYWEKSGKTEVLQACSDFNKLDNILASGFTGNGFLAALHASFAEHLPLRIDPDDIWLVFLSQVSLLINKYPEKYRDSFVNIQESNEIIVRHDGLLLDESVTTSSTKWEEIFPVFEKEMNKRMKIDMNLKFTTTTNVRYTASQIMIMGSMKNYFQYVVQTCCGIPEVRIGGSVEDWSSLKHKINDICTRIFSKDWKPKFGNFIEESIKVINGNPDPDFWEKLYHFDGGGGSGTGPSTTGYVNNLFPLDKEGGLGLSFNNKRSTETFPELTGYVPFIWEYFKGPFTKTFECVFKSGLTHASINDGEVSSKATWQIVRLSDEKSIEKDTCKWTILTDEQKKQEKNLEENKLEETKLGYSGYYLPTNRSIKEIELENSLVEIEKNMKDIFGEFDGE